MDYAIRRHPRRKCPGVESLEVRALLANAGAVNTSFGDQGVSTTPFEPPNAYFQGAGVTRPSAIESNGQILLSAVYLQQTVGNQSYAFAVERLEANGSPDPTFGTNGLAVVPTSLFGDEAQISALIPLPGGSILEVGTFFNNSLSGTTEVIELNSNGSLDTSYGTDGFVTLPTTIGNNLKIQGITGAALNASSQLLLTGAATNTSSTSPVADLFAARLNADGSVDSTFGNSGFATIAVPASNTTDYPDGTGGGIAIEPGGEIILTGEVASGTGTSAGGSAVPLYNGVVAGLTTDGTLDTMFGTSSNGIVVLPPNLANPTAAGSLNLNSLALQSNGSIVLGGTDYLGSTFSTSTGILIRLTAVGGVDMTFGQGGSVAITDQTVDGVAIQVNGQILVPGSASGKLAVGRFNADGNVDTSFGQPATPGLATYPSTTPYPSVGSSQLDNAFVDSAGQLILTGVTSYQLTNSIGETDDYSTFVAVRAFATPTITLAVDQPPADLANTGTTDYAVYLPTSGSFAYLTANNSALGQIVQFGIAGAGQTLPAAADYDGLGYSQIAAYLTASGVYAIQPTDGKPGVFVQFGMAGAGNSIPAPADYYGTGQDDIAVYMPSIAAFAIMATATQPGRIIPFGTRGAGQSIPAPADYYNTGQDDVAVYLAEQGAFAILAPGGQSGEIIPFGKPGIGQSIPVPGDYDGSGKTELAVYIPSQGDFFYRPANGGPDVEVPFGTANSGEIPVPGDYDGSGQTEFAVYDPTRGFIAYRPADGGPDQLLYFGGTGNGAIPVAAPAGNLPEFTGESSGSGTDTIPSAVVPSGQSGTASTAAIRLSQASTVPAAPTPTLASARVALSLVNQGDDDSSTITP